MPQRYTDIQWVVQRNLTHAKDLMWLRNSNAFAKSILHSSYLIVTLMNDSRFWEIIEQAWQASPALLEMRNTALETNDAIVIEDLTSVVYGAITNNIRDVLLGLDKETLTGFNHLMEEKLYHIDRKDIHAFTDGSDDGFLYCRCFIVGMGQTYYNKIDREPAMATADAEAEIVGFIGYMVYQELFGEEFERNTIHCIETCSNSRGWEA